MDTIHDDGSFDSCVQVAIHFIHLAEQYAACRIELRSILGSIKPELFGPLVIQVMSEEPKSVRAPSITASYRLFAEEAEKVANERGLPVPF